jgi:deoxyadenosine/deoxycytidine kinase
MQVGPPNAMSQKSALSHTRYIVTEGPIGVGKTSLTSLLAEELGARLILERAEDNPFLTDFYKEPSRYRFQTQTFFLLNRFAQQVKMLQPDLFTRIAISDYLFAKDRIFAYLNLDDHELALYEQIYKILEPKVAKPDLVIFLQADTDTLLRRINLRGRSFETDVDRDYVAAVNEAYNQYFFHYSETPLLVINTSDIDFVNRREDLDDLLKQVLNMKQGIQYYVPKSRGKSRLMLDKDPRSEKKSRIVI